MHKRHTYIFNLFKVKRHTQLYIWHTAGAWQRGKYDDVPRRSVLTALISLLLRVHPDTPDNHIRFSYLTLPAVVGAVSSSGKLSGCGYHNLVVSQFMSRAGWEGDCGGWRWSGLLIASPLSAVFCQKWRKCAPQRPLPRVCMMYACMAWPMCVCTCVRRLWQHWHGDNQSFIIACGKWLQTFWIFLLQYRLERNWNFQWCWIY